MNHTALIILFIIFASGCIDTSTNNESTSTVLPDGQIETYSNTSTVTPDVENQNEITDNSNVAIGTMSNITQWFSEKDNKNTIYALVGDTIIIELEENPTTGYSWNMKHSEGLELKEDTYFATSIDAELVGALGSRMWFFEVTETDEQVVSGIYVHPWEEVTGTEDSYELTIDVVPESELIKTTGTVTYNDLEGGFYGIVGTNDTRYDPVNLPDDFRIDGTEVRFTAYPHDDMMSFHMWEQIIEIRTISPVL